MVDKFIFPMDFVVLDFEEVSKCPLILGRLFLNTEKAIIDVHEGKITLRVGDERVEFVMPKLMKYPIEEEFCMRVEVVDECVREVNLNKEIIDKSLESEVDSEPSQEVTFVKPEILIRSDNPTPPSIVKPPKLELKPLPTHLRYTFLGEGNTLPIIISNKLSIDQEKRVCEIVRNRVKSIGWQISDIKGISPSIVMYRIHMEEGIKSVIERQRRLNPNMKEVVKKEIIKLLDAGIIYPISDSKWVSPVQCV